MKLAPTLLPCFLVFAPVISQAQESYWANNLPSGYFDDLSNWDPAVAPGPTHNGVFGHPGYLQVGEVVFRAAQTGNTFTVRSGSFTFSFEPGGSLHLGNGAFYLNTAETTTFQAGGALSAANLTAVGGTTVLKSHLTLSNTGDVGGHIVSHILSNTNFTVDSTGQLTMLANGNGLINQLVIGNTTGSSTFTLQNGGKANLQGTEIVLGAAAGGSGTIQHQTGTLTVDNASTLYLAGQGHGTYHLSSGGVLEIGGTSLQGAKATGGTYDFLLKGGKIVVTGSGLITDIDSKVVSGRSVIDTNGFDSEWAGNITTDPLDNTSREFAKEGSGHLIFSGAQRDLFNFATLGGTMDQTAGDTTAKDFLVGYGAGNTASYDLNGGSITVSSSLRIGDYGGTGVFNHYDGDVTMEANTSLNIGNLGGKIGETPVEGNGTYNLYGGKLTLNAGSHNLGRSTASGGVSHGVFNLFDGLLLVQNGGQIIVGNREASTSAGTGTFVQTGGIADFTDGKLFVGSYGHGSYSLNGGELRIAAGSLLANYLNTGGGYKFNFGGGTIKVTGEGVDTEVAMTLTSETTSTINTNGYAATFRSAISGDGDLVKSGVGKLTLYSLTAGKVSVQKDTLEARSLTADEVEIDEGARLESNNPDVALLRLNGGSVASVSGALQIGAMNHLAGVGTIDSDSVISGTLTAGSFTEAGVIASTGKLSTKESSLFQFGVFENSTTNGSYSRIESTGGFGFDEELALHLVFGENVDFSDAFWETSGHRWIFFDGNVASDELPLDFVLTSNVGYDAFGYFTLYSDEVLGVGVEWQAIPEPSTVALLVGAGALLLGFQRRRRS